MAYIIDTPIPVRIPIAINKCYLCSKFRMSKNMHSLILKDYPTKETNRELCICKYCMEIHYDIVRDLSSICNTDYSNDVDPFCVVDIEITDNNSIENILNICGGYPRISYDIDTDGELMIEKFESLSNPILPIIKIMKDPEDGHIWVKAQVNNKK